MSQILESSSKRHVGSNIQRIRTYLGIKQSALAADTGLNQQEISAIEHQEHVEEGILTKIADALGVTTDMIKNFDVERAIYQINHVRDNTFTDGATAISQHFNPIEKIVELYERLLKSEREKIDLFKAQNHK